jgi:hypothetical protein
MALIRCSSCGCASLNVDQRCQFCGKALKLYSIWKRKLRRKEVYGFLLVLTGCLMSVLLKFMGIGLLFLGMMMILSSLLTPRWR